MIFLSTTGCLTVVTHTKAHVLRPSQTFPFLLFKKPLKASVAHTTPFRSKQPETIRQQATHIGYFSIVQEPKLELSFRTELTQEGNGS